MNHAFRNLVFEGGGVKGIAYGGALARLEEKGILSNILRVAGTSAGAINATLMAVGYTANEVGTIIAETSFADFEDDTAGPLRDIKRVLNDYGWHKGNVFEKWIGGLIMEKTENRNLTFGELHAMRMSELASGSTSLRDLYVVGTNLSTQLPEVYSYETTPDVKIRKAARISMSIPLYFRCVRNEEEEVLVDGGVTRNYPIDLFDHERYLENSENGEEVDYNQTDGFVFNHETLGFRLDDNGVKVASMLSNSPIPHDIDNLADYAKALVGFIRQMAVRMHLHSNDWNRTIVIDTTGVGVTEFKVSEQKIHHLLHNGAAGVDNHFAWREGQDGPNLPV